jgi:ZIP family zinc transporter
MTKGASRKTLDGMLGFAAGAITFVVVEEIVPESQRANNTDLATMGTMGAMMGFTVMMVLDVGFG